MHRSDGAGGLLSELVAHTRHGFRQLAGDLRDLLLVPGLLRGENRGGRKRQDAGGGPGKIRAQSVEGHGLSFWLENSDRASLASHWFKIVLATLRSRKVIARRCFSGLLIRLVSPKAKCSKPKKESFCPTVRAGEPER